MVGVIESHIERFWLAGKRFDRHQDHVDAVPAGVSHGLNEPGRTVLAQVYLAIFLVGGEAG
jgi:hypothetical protein